MFDEALPQHHSLMQDPAFAQALRLCGQSPLHLPGGLMVLQRQFAGLRVAMLPRAAPPKDLADQLRAVGLHRTPLILSPDTPASLPKALRLQRPRRTAIWHIGGGSQTVRKAFHQKWRNQLKRAEAANMRVSSHALSPDPNGTVLQAAARQAKDRRYVLWPAPLTAAFATVAANQCHLFRAKSKGHEVAHLLFLSHGDTATYHIGHTTSLGRSLNAHNLLLWRAAQQFSARGISRIDLGLVDGQKRGLDRFKLRTGAEVVLTGGTHLYWRPWTSSKSP